METSTCRLPEKLSDRLDRAAEERGAFESEIVRRAIRFYIDENPDGIRAFTSGPRGGNPSSGSGVDSGGAVEDGSGGNGMEWDLSRVYDPMEEE